MQTDEDGRGDEWADVVDLVERVMADEDLLPQVVAGVRSIVAEVAMLPAADIAGHTRVLLTAATRALVARRGPTEAELAFVEDLAVARAMQGIPIEAVLGAIHVAERAIWSRARELAGDEGVGAVRLLDARELYDDWAESVRSRLIAAHRDVRSRETGPRGDRDVRAVRRMLEGGTASTLAVAECGLPQGSGLWVLVARHGDQGAADGVRRLHSPPSSLSAPIDDTLVCITSSGPESRAGWDTGGVVGVAGPVAADEVGVAHRHAVSVVAAAEAIGRDGPVHVGEVSAVAAMLSRTDLTSVLVERCQGARDELGRAAVPVALTVRTWLEADRDVDAVAGVLFVHANTVRNRVQRFAGATGIDPFGTFGAVDAWWLCRAWLGDTRPALTASSAHQGRPSGGRGDRI